MALHIQHDNKITWNKENVILMKVYENQTAKKWRLRQSKNCSSSNGHMTKHLTVIQNAR